MKIKFAERDRSKKDQYLDGEIISRTGGVLAYVPPQEGGNQSHSVTHILTGGGIKFLSIQLDCERFARAFYKQLTDEEKQILKTECDPKKLPNLLSRKTRAFVLDWGKKR